MGCGYGWDLSPFGLVTLQSSDPSG